MPQNTARMMQTHPSPITLFDQGTLAECIDACFCLLYTSPSPRD